MPRIEPTSDAERALRSHLAHAKKIKSERDSRGLHDWLRSLGMNPNEDHRSLWEKRLQARLKDALGLEYESASA